MQKIKYYSTFGVHDWNSTETESIHLKIREKKFYEQVTLAATDIKWCRKSENHSIPATYFQSAQPLVIGYKSQ